MEDETQRGEFEHVAEVAVRGLVGYAHVPVGFACLSLRRLEEYVRGRTSLVLGPEVLSHAGSCARCRRLLADLRRVERRRQGLMVWNLNALRALRGSGSELAEEASRRVAAWLPSLTQSGVAEHHPRALGAEVAPVWADAGKPEVTLRCPPMVDGRGRLVLQMGVGLPHWPGVVEVAIRGGSSRLELFACMLCDPILEAIVDLSACAPPSSALRPEAFVVRIGPAEVPAERRFMVSDELRAVESVPELDLASIDGVLGVAEDEGVPLTTPDDVWGLLPESVRSRYATAAKLADTVSRYVAAWRVGNAGEVPWAAARLLLALCGEGAEEPVAQVATSLAVPVVGPRAMTAFTHRWRHEVLEEPA